MKHWPTEKCFGLEGQVPAKVKSNLVKKETKIDSVTIEIQGIGDPGYNYNISTIVMLKG